MVCSNRFYKQITCVLASMLLAMLVVINNSFAAETPEADITLISNINSIKPDANLMLGIHFKLPHGWQTFWRTPGDAGYGASFSWEGSKNLDKAEVLWPYPHRIVSDDIIENVYMDEVLFPVKVTVKKTNEPLYIKLQINYLLCQPGSCVPLKKDLTLTLPAGTGKSAKEAPLIQKWMSKIPESENSKQMTLGELKIVNLEEDKASVRVMVITSNGLNNSALLFTEGSNKLKMNVPELRQLGDTNGYFNFTIEKNPDQISSQSLDQLLQYPIKLTFVNNQHAITLSKVPGLYHSPKFVINTCYGLLLICILLLLGYVFFRVKKSKTSS